MHTSCIKVYISLVVTTANEVVGETQIGCCQRKLTTQFDVVELNFTIRYLQETCSYNITLNVPDTKQ